MREELSNVQCALARQQLPRTLGEVFGDLYDEEQRSFVAQESALHDYKRDIPEDFSGSYGAAIVRLALAFYNTYGGLIVFGVDDESKEIVGSGQPINVEALNRTLSDVTTHNIECVCQTYRVAGDDDGPTSTVVLVPKRGSSLPAKLTRKLDKYPKGTVFVRQRHEVLVAKTYHLPLLFSQRTDYGSQFTNSIKGSIQKSIPPSFASMKSFIGRDDLLSGLWEWLVSGRDPRRYLFGPGGSGKSTLAYEFAQSITSSYGGILLPNGESIDYVVYLSAKETEFNVFTGGEQPFVPRDFSNAEEQMAKILYHSGTITEGELQGMSLEDYEAKLDELFNNFNGLIVLDDIDALSRASKDTGEEYLFYAAVRAACVTRFLYTLRSPPSSALNSSVNVPGLDFASEYCEFIEAYSTQLGAAQPTSQELVAVFEETGGIPLLIELAVGLRRHFSSYADVLTKMREIDGDAIRGYLYRREYERIRSDRTKLMLALLSMVDAPLDAISMENLLGTTSQQLRDSISETSGIFIMPAEGRDGEVLYELVDAAKPFILAKNADLKYVGQLERKVRHFAQGPAVTTRAERLLIVQLLDSVRAHKWDEVRGIGDQINPTDVRLANPVVRSFLGQGYAAVGGSPEKAREHFRAVDGMNVVDGHMMRSWYYLESNNGAFQDSQKVCRKVLSDDRYGDRIKSEFAAKLADTFFRQSIKIGNSNPPKAKNYLIKSVVHLNESIILGRGDRDNKKYQILSWLDRSLGVMFRSLFDDPEDAFRLVKELIDSKRDVDAEAYDLIKYYVENIYVGQRSVGVSSLYGLSRTYGAEIGKIARVAARFPSTLLLLKDIQGKFEELYNRHRDELRSSFQ
jgi:hypothetical protein